MEKRTTQIKGIMETDGVILSKFIVITVSYCQFLVLEFIGNYFVTRIDLFSYTTRIDH